MKGAQTIGCLGLLILLAGGLYWMFSGFFTRGALVENLDAVVANVDQAASAGRIAEPLKTEAAGSQDDGPFAAQIKSFLAGSAYHNWAGTTLPAAFPLPIAVIDLDAKRYDAIGDDLPDAARADTAAAARTIVFIRCVREKVGRYGYILAHDAYDLKCDELAVDMKARGGPVILAVGAYENAPPQEIDTRFTFGDVVAERSYNVKGFVLNGVAPGK